MSLRSVSRWGFASGQEYVKSLAKTPFLLRHAVSRGVPHTTEEDAEAGASLSRTLGWFNVSCLGVGLILGAGIFVSTGEAAATLSGPAVVLSFVVAGLSALLSSLVYSEFAVQFPISGGAFNYIYATLGELAAWLIVASLILNYVLANAAVARSWAPYFAMLIQKPSDFFVIESGGYEIDLWAVGLILICSALLMRSTGESALVNLIITIVHVAVVVFIIIAGFVKANPANLTPFAPFGVRGVFDGASFVFFSYIGFDAVSNMAEEVRKPERDMPIGIISCIVFVTCIYVLMALCLVMMVPIGDIDTGAAFAAAFQYVGMPWGVPIVAIGALLGIFTGVLVGTMAVSRLLSAVGRTHLVPPIIGHISPRFHTPMVATAVVMIATLPLGLLTDLPQLINLTATGVLVVFAVVAVGLIAKRYFGAAQPTYVDYGDATGDAKAAGIDGGASGIELASSPPSKVSFADGVRDKDAASASAGAAPLASAKDAQSVTGANPLAAGSGPSKDPLGRPASSAVAAGAPVLHSGMSAVMTRVRRVPLGRRIATAALILGLCVTGALLGVMFGTYQEWYAYVAVCGAHVVLTAALQVVGVQTDTPPYSVPLFPWVPSASLLLNCYLLGSLPAESFVQYAIFLAIIIGIYLLYGLHGAIAFRKREELLVAGKKAVELHAV